MVKRFVYRKPKVSASDFLVDLKDFYAAYAKSWARMQFVWPALSRRTILKKRQYGLLPWIWTETGETLRSLRKGIGQYSLVRNVGGDVVTLRRRSKMPKKFEINDEIRPWPSVSEDYDLAFEILRNITSTFRRVVGFGMYNISKKLGAMAASSTGLAGGFKGKVFQRLPENLFVRGTEKRRLLAKEKNKEVSMIIRKIRRKRR
ncbi:MAG: hypothetical protein ACP5QX_06680 [Caldisericaceae bacterium]